MKKITFCTIALAMIMYGISMGQVTPEDEAEGSSEHISVYHGGLFTGFTTNTKHKTTDFTVGIDYEYRMMMTDYYMGIGFFVEGVFAEHKESLFGVPIFFHPIGGWKIYIAPGVIFGDVPVESANGTITEETKSESNFLMRFGTSYDFHLGMFSISPGLALDLVKGQTSIVYGLTFGLGL